jgi:hypothetical protein
MKRCIILIILFSLIFGGWQFPSWREARQQLVVAEKRVTQIVANGTNNLDLSDLTKLRRLPSNIGEISNLAFLNVRDTNLNDLSGLEGNATLSHLDLNHTRIADLTPLKGIPNLQLVYLHGTWVRDISPLATLPSLERLDLGQTQIETLQPVTDIEGLIWLNLHKSHAIDGSQEFVIALEARPFLDLSGGAAFKQNYRPGWQYNTVMRISRLRMQLGL